MNFSRLSSKQNLESVSCMNDLHSISFTLDDPLFEAKRLIADVVISSKKCKSTAFQVLHLNCYYYY